MNKVFTQPLVYTAVMISLLSGCSDGDDGKPGLDGKLGEDGKPGTPSLIIATSAERLSLKYLDASINDDGASTAKFEVLNELDLPVVGINSVSFIKAQLLSNPKGFSEFQYLGDLDCTTAKDSCLTDHGNGSYTVTDPKQQSQYDKSVPQRFVLSLSKHNGNSIYSENLLPEIAETIDFMVDGSELTSSRKMITTAKCNECHTDLAFTKNGYEGESHYTNDINGCITCHADGNDIKGAKGEQLNAITKFAHEWHNTLHGEKVKIAYDCTSCHATENTSELPNGIDWLSDTTNDKACLSCHPAEDLKHRADLALNCSACHSTEEIHTKTSKIKKATLDTVKIDILDVQPTILPTLSPRHDGGQYQTAELEVTIRLTDSEGAPITVSPIEAGWFKYLDVSFAWDAENAYHFLALEAEGYPGLVPNSDGELSARASHANNVSFNNAPKQMIIRSVPEKGEYTYKVSGVPDPTISTRASNGLIIPVGTEDKTGIIAIETVIFIDPDTGKPLKGSDATGTVRSSVAFFNMDGLVEKGRRTIVTNETCAACHGDQGYAEHGDSRNDMEQQCAACHAPGNSEWDEAHLLNGIAPKDPLTDHLAWNIFVHAMHAQGREDQQLGGIVAKDPNGVTVEIEQRRAFEYPARLSDCSQCHVEGTTNLDEIEKGTAVITRKVYEQFAPRYATSPAAATCWSCHAGKPGEKNEALRSHMKLNGATFETEIIDGVNATINGSMILDVVLPRESCSVCHTEDNINKVHHF